MVWIKYIKPWVVIAWTFLTMGIALGSWWAYYELGWGGWWYWDPVENSSFLPWIILTALLHTNVVFEKRENLKIWVILLSIISFSLSLLGTFLVRSGIITSVHSFAQDPTRGLVILSILAIIVGASLFLFGLNAHKIKDKNEFYIDSKETSMLINNVLLILMCVLVLFGTLYPLIAELIFDNKVSVGAPFFNKVFSPFAILLSLFLSWAIFSNWKKTTKISQKIKYILGSFGASLIFTILFTSGKETAPLVLVGVFTGFSVLNISLIHLAYNMQFKLKKIGLPLLAQFTSHFGLGLILIGAGVSVDWKQEKVLNLQIGESTDIAGYTYTLLDIKNVKGKTHKSVQGVFKVQDISTGKEIAKLYPESRINYPSRQPTTETDVKTYFTGDLYATIGERNPDGSIVTRLYYNPYILFLWLGVTLFSISGFIIIYHRRKG